MPEFDGSQVSDVPASQVLPAGTYNVSIVEVEEGTTAAGDPMWNVKMAVHDKGYTGAVIYDNIPWSDRAAVRVKQFLKCFGVYSDYTTIYETWDLEGKHGRVKTVVEEYESTKAPGQKQKRTKVPFAGYYTYHHDKAPAKAAPASSEPEKDVPF